MYWFGLAAPAVNDKPYASTLLSRKDRDRIDQRRWVPSMRHYEIMVILEPETDERTINASLEKLLQVVPG